MVIMFFFSVTILLIPSTAFAETIEIEFTKFVWLGYNELYIHFEGQSPPNFNGWWFLYDRDSELVTTWGIYADEDGKFWGTGEIIVQSSLRVVDNGMGYVEIYAHEDFNGMFGPKPDNSKSLLTKKVNIEIYRPQKEIHIVTVKDGNFIPETLKVNLYDLVDFEVDCEDCYKFQWIESPSSLTNKPVPLKPNLLDREGIYKIADIFEHKTELIIEVIYPSPVISFTTTTSEPMPTLELTLEPEPTPEPEQKIPDWVRNIFTWYAEGQIGEDDLIGALQFLIKEGIILV